MELVVAVLTPPVNVPLAPLEGAVNVAGTPLTGLFPASFTVACSCVANAALIVVLCGVPSVAMILAASPPVPAALNAAAWDSQLFAAPPLVLTLN